MNKDLGVTPTGSGSREPSQQAVSAAAAASIPNAAEARREVHGVHLTEGLRQCPDTVRETDTKIIIGGGLQITLNPASARHLARTLYRLARRIEKRTASGIEAPSGDETRSGSAVGESPAPEGGDAQ